MGLNFPPSEFYLDTHDSADGFAFGDTMGVMAAEPERVPEIIQCSPWPASSLATGSSYAHTEGWSLSGYGSQPSLFLESYHDNTGHSALSANVANFGHDILQCGPSNLLLLPSNGSANEVSRPSPTRGAGPKASELNFLEAISLQEKNRLAATKCRKKKKGLVQNLERRESDLLQQQKALRGQIAQLETDILVLKSEILRHAFCGDGNIDLFIRGETDSVGDMGFHHALDDLGD